MPNSLITVQIINADKMIAAFHRAPKLMSAALTNAINKSLFQIGGQAARNAPVRTGNLRSSILDPSRGLRLATQGVFSGSVGSGVGYGLFVELGTRFMRAQPFLQPAVVSEDSTVKGFFLEAVNSVLNDIERNSK